MPTETTKRPRVVIVGAGFGGLWATKKLAGKPVDVVLIDRNNYHTFIPLLYQVAAAELDPEQIAYPVRSLVRRHKNIQFVMGEVERVDLDARRVVTSDEEIEYDYLILAAGSVTNFFGNESIATHAFGMKDLEESVLLRSHILTLCERAAQERDPVKRKALLTFVIVGGGPTGVEFAATVAELLWTVLARDFPDLDMSEAQVLLLEAMDSILPIFDPASREYTRKVLEEKGVDVRLGAMVAGATADVVKLADGTEIPTHTLVWSAGVKASPLVEQLGVELGRGARVMVNEHLQIPQRPEVFVVGDMSYTEWGDKSPVPQVAPAAIQQGELAGENILRTLSKAPLLTFEYKDKGTMVTIGRNRGVARVGNRTVKGFIAWAAWLFVHLLKLIGFRNRLLVLTNWAWNYIFYERAVRLILPKGKSKS